MTTSGHRSAPFGHDTVPPSIVTRANISGRFRIGSKTGSAISGPTQAAAHGGTVLFAPLRVRVRAGKLREPDLVVLRDAGDPRRRNDFWTGADLVVEVVSPDDPDRDLRHSGRIMRKRGFRSTGSSTPSTRR